MRLTRLAVLAAALVGCAGTAHADSPAQARQAIQAVCDRTAAAYARRDLPGYLAQFAHGFKLTNVTGHTSDFLTLQAGMAGALAQKDRIGSCRCAVGAVSLSGGQARVALTWHFQNRHGGRVPYSYIRDYTEQSLWTKAGGRWTEVQGRFVRDTITYQK